MIDTASGLLLDACAVIWLAHGILSFDATILAGLAADVFVLPISAWEIGLPADAILQI